MAPRNPHLSREADAFVQAASLACKKLEQAMEYYPAFMVAGLEEDAETARLNAHAHLDAYCDNIRSAHKNMEEG